MRTNPYITRAILLGTAFAASSCMMGPDFKPVDMPMPAAFRGAPAATESIADLPWWKVFKNKDLQDLLTDTYNNNRDLKATMARVEKARQYITITEAPLFPWADYSGSVSKGSNYTGGSIVQTTGTTLTPGALDAGISWELDIWGKTRRMTEAARADYLASEEGQRALMLSLLRQVADSYLQLLQLDEQLAIVQKSVESYSESLRLFDEQLEGQVGHGVRVRRARVTAQPRRLKGDLPAAAEGIRHAGAAAIARHAQLLHQLREGACLRPQAGVHLIPDALPKPLPHFLRPFGFPYQIRVAEFPAPVTLRHFRRQRRAGTGQRGPQARLQRLRVHPHQALKQAQVPHIVPRGGQQRPQHACLVQNERLAPLPICSD